MTRLIGLALLALSAANLGGGNDGADFRSNEAHGRRNLDRGVSDMPMVRQLDLSGSGRGVGSTASGYSLRIHGLASDGIAAAEPVATATAVPGVTPIPEPTQDAPVYGGFPGEITHYGESFNGRTMACGGTYWSSDTTIAAVPYPSRNREWPCGTRFVVSGPAGSIEVVRTDSCPGCSNPNHLDLSESGFEAVCGPLSIGRCAVWIEVR